jgi:hypothetical protein
MCFIKWKFYEQNVLEKTRPSAVRSMNSRGD